MNRLATPRQTELALQNRREQLHHLPQTLTFTPAT
ncbi:hypothetical protein F4827_006406 [Paraburkholderia bannensis]|uniref:Uncharacterized protein n=1 Tax=Paraburkholderia bannensis TaxID=765414 RepID=A0A7W9WUL6_9BURK|nr:hypothetical protein [Paraburkholderia sp. WP4_3_2]MBB6106530.1 hypothetical protein [Paraburkholderia bannensis]